jgi:hypothetical protein
MKTRNKALCRHAMLAGLWLIGFPMITPMAQVPTDRKLHQPNSPICSNSWATKMLAFSGNCRFLFFV